MKGKKNSGREVLIIVLVFALTLVLVRESQATIYKYVDNKGVECYTDSLQAVPQKYRKKAVLIDGNPAAARAGVSGPKIGAQAAGDTAGSAEKEPESLSEKAKSVFAAIAGSKAARTGGVIAASVLLFWIAGKAGNALGHQIVGLVLRFIITVLVLFYVFGSYFNEAGNAFITLKEDVLGLKKQTQKHDEEINKAVNELFPEPHK